VLGVPKDKKIDVLLAVGYYDSQNIGPRHDREPLEKMASFNGYEGAAE
jgi:hypothetical protein